MVSEGEGRPKYDTGKKLIKEFIYIYLSIRINTKRVHVTKHTTKITGHNTLGGGDAHHIQHIKCSYKSTKQKNSTKKRGGG